ncbi:MarR family transcriptional regulator [Bacillus sp. 31A1R]|uniref:MarR family transcriptional regulator n=1 Tax=Robertmurraya mangrovi TaxID=3098077 RepID=A0ABU5IYC4_9BACI|nr:MarR family transcriptional regulator [Bacillus sp. 31A1R]MDZ5472184.1 MarR family transcriptional regulator [Bacillus sp. 31A1R]
MNNLGYLLQLSAKLMKYQLNKELEQKDFTPAQWAIIKHLQILEEHDAPIDQFMAVSMAHELDMDKPTISGVIKRLTDKGFIEKLPHPTDKRAFILCLTSKTKEMIPSLEELSDKTIKKATTGFTPNELEELTRYLIRVSQNLKE